MVDRLNDQRVMPEYIYNYTCNFAFRAELDAGNYESREYERPIGNPSFFRENHASKIVSRLPICNAYLYGSSFNYGPPGLIDIQNALFTMVLYRRTSVDLSRNQAPEFIYSVR